MKPFGIKLTDALGATYKRWENTEGCYEAPKGISTELIDLGVKVSEMSLRKAVKHVQSLDRSTPIIVEVLYEKDYTE